MEQLATYAGAFSARTAQITRNVSRYEAEWRIDNPTEEPGPRLRRSWDRRAWAEARPDKVIPRDGRELAHRWTEELHDLGYAALGGASAHLPSSDSGGLLWGESWNP